MELSADPRKGVIHKQSCRGYNYTNCNPATPVAVLINKHKFRVPARQRNYIAHGSLLTQIPRGQLTGKIDS